MKKCFCSGLLVPLPIECIDGSRLLLIHGGAKWKPKEYNIYDLFKCLMIMMEVAVMEPATQVRCLLNVFSYLFIIHFTDPCVTVQSSIYINIFFFQIAGVQVIIDSKNLPFSHVPYITPKFAAMMAEWIQRCLPCRLKNIHIINQPFIANIIFTVFKPFLSVKIKRKRKKKKYIRWKKRGSNINE